jgi:hypothetical protein
VLKTILLADLISFAISIAIGLVVWALRRRFSKKMLAEAVGRACDYCEHCRKCHVLIKLGKGQCIESDYCAQCKFDLHNANVHVHGVAIQREA